MKSYVNCHAGKRAFVIGNGPSLRDTDLHKLAGEVTFGSNRIYLYPFIPDLLRRGGLVSGAG